MKKALTVLSVLPALSVVLTSCTSEVSVKKDTLTDAQLTRPGDIALYPDDRPSIPNGRVYYQQQNCASCHGANGAVPQTFGNKTVILSDKDYIRSRKPIDQYFVVAYGKGENGVDVPNHPKMAEKLTKRQTWDMVFYSRSLAIPELPDTTIAEIDPVFGSNCAVCHGKSGKGDGPLAHNLEPVPANFSLPQRFYDRTDAILYDHIANGIKWEGMPNFLGKEDKAKNVKFDKDYIWKLVQYVRNFHSSNEATDPIAIKEAEAAAPGAKDSNKTKTQ